MSLPPNSEKTSENDDSVSEVERIPSRSHKHPASMWLRSAAAIASGASMTLVSPPIGEVWIHWFNLVPLFWALSVDVEARRKNGWLCYLFGFSLICFNYSWISVSVTNFSNLPQILAWACVGGYALISATPFWLLGYAVALFRKHYSKVWIFLIPGVQVALEQLWPALFPYYHGALMYRSLEIWQFASIFGVTSISYLIFLINALLSEILIYHRRAPCLKPKSIYIQLGLCCLLMSGVVGFGFWRLQKLESDFKNVPSIRVAMLQQDVTMQHRLSRNPWEAVRDWTGLTLKTVNQNPDLVIWPEGAMGGPLNPDDTQAYSALGGRSLKGFFEELTTRYNFNFLIGGGTITFHDELDEQGYPKYTAYNSCYLFSHEGKITGRYDKMILLPFGEYMPLADVFPFLGSIRGPGKFKAGSDVTYFKANKNNVEYSFSTPICYEAILNSQMRKMADADLFINITNDAWFGDTAAPHQHAMLTTVQAIEWGRPLLRIAYTGVSFVVEPSGKILYETKPFVEEAKVETLRLAKTKTLYRQGGWIFPWLWIGITPILLYISRRRETL